MTHPPADRPADRRVDAISEQYLEDYAAHDPIAATYLGLVGHDAELTDLTPDGFAAREELTRAALAEATAATPVDEREAVARDSFLERLGLEVVPETGCPRRASRSCRSRSPRRTRGASRGGRSRRA